MKTLIGFLALALILCVQGCSPEPKLKSVDVKDLPLPSAGTSRMAGGGGAKAPVDEKTKDNADVGKEKGAEPKKDKSKDKASDSGKEKSSDPAKPGSSK